MATTRKATVRLKYGKKGFQFVKDGSANDKRMVYYTTKRAAKKGVSRFMGEKPYNLVDETGVTDRGTPKK